MNAHGPSETERLPRNAQLTAALRVMSAATPDADYDAMEARLRLAFTERQRARRRVRRMRWSQVAAVFVVMCGGAGLWLWLGQTRVTSRQPLAARSMAAENSAAVPFVQPVARRIVTADPAGPARTTPVDSARVDAIENAISVLADFIPLPGAGALPEFERGGIVRIELPVASLAAYGLDMVPDATPTSVPADLLIGQDGVPRAIRLTSERVR